ncbi:MAG: hypothetical protein GX981_09625 [Tissierellia bacterium]|nr:hypothetical protein [Tissierellia bacterium]
MWKSIFKQNAAKIIIGEYNNEPVGFTLFFHNFSTFLGRLSLYLKDLFIISVDLRGMNLGVWLGNFKIS